MKKVQVARSPAEIEASGAMTAADWAKAREITAQLLSVPAPAADRGRDAAGAADTPLLIGGEIEVTAKSVNPCPAMDSEDFQDEFPKLVFGRTGEVRLFPGVRCVKGQKVGIDWVSCVFQAEAAWKWFVGNDKLIQMQQLRPVSDEQVASVVRDIFAWVMAIQPGESDRWKVFTNGLNGYRYAIGMPSNAGIVHAGHRSDTVLVVINGSGCMAAGDGWETRLQWFLSGVAGWLTRLDLAYDDYEGEMYGVRKMRKLANRKTTFRHAETAGRPPKIELRGDWTNDDPDGSGLTMYVGSRMSGKYLRIYEKGRQLGDAGSDWVRVEVELHSSAFVLALDMLTSPTKYFAAMYPCCEWIERGGDRKRVEYKARWALMTIENSVNWIRHQAGGHLAALRTHYEDAQLLDLLCRPDAVPAGLRLADKVIDQVLAPSESLTDEPGLVEA